MISKKFILSAENFGVGQAENQAVLEGYVNGFLTSASLCTNTKAFDSAIHDILPDCPDLELGICLNILTNRALTDCYSLTNSYKDFNKNFLFYFFNRKNKKILAQIENEFRAQITRATSQTKISHITSAGYIHSIPEIFEIVARLAKEFNILYVQTHFEDLYFVKNIKTHLSFTYLRNIVKLLIFQKFTQKNKKTLQKYSLKTNDNIIGLGYQGLMTSETIEQGLMTLDNETNTVECIIQPKKTSNQNNSHTKDFLITQDLTLKDTINRLGFDITNYKNIE